MDYPEGTPFAHFAAHGSSLKWDSYSHHRAIG